MVKTLGTSLAWEGRVIPGVPRERQVLQEREPPPARREVSNPEGRAVRAGDRRGALAEVRVAREEAREVVAEVRVAREEARAAAAEVREAREEAREVVAEVPVDRAEQEERLVRPRFPAPVTISLNVDANRTKRVTSRQWPVPRIVLRQKTSPFLLNARRWGNVWLGLLASLVGAKTSASRIVIVPNSMPGVFR